jgi:hypothetical protein
MGVKVKGLWRVVDLHRRTTAKSWRGGNHG